MFSFFGCWHYSHDNERNKYIGFLSVFWFCFIFLNVVCYIVRLVYASTQTGVSFIFTVYFICCGIHGLVCCITFGITCFRKHGLHYLLDKLLPHQKNQKLNRIMNILICLIICYASAAFCINLTVFLLQKTLILVRNFYKGMSSDMAVFAMIIYDNLVIFPLNIIWTGLPALQTSISFYFFLEFKGILKELKESIKNKFVYNCDKTLLEFMQKYLKFGSLVQKLTVFSVTPSHLDLEPKCPVFIYYSIIPYYPHVQWIFKCSILCHPGYR